MSLGKKLIRRIDFFVFFLIIIAIVSHIEWFNINSTLFFLDWSHRNDAVTSQIWNFGWSTWMSPTSLGYQNIQLYMFIPISIWGFIGKYDLAVKVTYLWPIAILSLLAPYYLLRKISRDKIISFLGALAYGLSTYLLMRSCAHLPIAFVYSLTPLILLSFIFFLEKTTYFRLTVFLLLYSLGLFYEVRIMYVVSIIIFVYFLVFFEKEKFFHNKVKFIISALVIFLLNSFWLFPTILGDKTAISAVADRGLWGNDYLSILKSLAFFDWRWSGSAYIQDFISQPILAHIWLVPIISFLAFFQFKNEAKKNKKYIIFFGLILVMGLLLSKQENEPFPYLYLWLVNNFPGFNLFREASKFYLLLGVGYLGLFAFGLKYLFSKIGKNVFIVLTLSIILLINAKPLFTKEIGALFVNRVEPIDYEELDSKIQNDNEEFYRTLWVPFYSKWAYYKNSRPKVSLWEELNKADGIKKFSSINPGLKNFTNPELYSNIFNDGRGKEILDTSSIKYVIIPKDLPESEDMIFPYAGDRNSYVEEFDKIPYLKKETIGGIDIYENEGYKPHIYLTEGTEAISEEVPFKKIDFEQQNPTEYKIHLKNISRPFNLNFSESFHPDWKLRAGDFNWFAVLTDKYYFLSGKFHRKNDASLNSFKIDPEYLKRNYPGAVSENPDGTINVEMTLYFKPQSYFYLGLIISITTLIGCLGYLFFDFFKRKKENEAKNKPLI
jgi:hypothetical protein